LEFVLTNFQNSTGLQLPSKNSIRFCFSSTWRWGRSWGWKAAAPFSKKLFLPTVENRRLQTQFLTQIRNWHLNPKDAASEQQLSFSSVVFALFPHTFAPLF
jgi:hypothetical protein